MGLTKVAPLSRRGFMTASAAVTAGYTLAAGPVLADVIHTDTNGLTTGDAKIKVADGALAPEMKTPVLGLYGGADAAIPVSDVEAFETALAKAHKPAEFKIQPGAPHGFHADHRASDRQYKVLG